jgi:hypothetical protein
MQTYRAACKALVVHRLMGPRAFSANRLAALASAAGAHLIASAASFRKRPSAASIVRPASREQRVERARRASDPIAREVAVCLADDSHSHLGVVSFPPCQYGVRRDPSPNE